MLVMERYRIIIWRFFTLIIAWSVFQNSGGTLVYRYNEGPVDWQSAQTECQSSGGNLVNGSTEYQLMNCTSFPKKKIFWIGMYSMFSPWIQITGCFQLNTSFITGQFYTEDALECSENCGTYFGLMGKSCFCLSDDWTNDDNILVPDSLCPIKCRRNEQDSCGGNNYTTVYNKVQDQDITDRDDETAKDNIMCGLVECTYTGWQYYGYACNQSLPAYCNDMNKTTIEHWEAGQEICWNTYKSFLMGATIQNAKCELNETSRAPSWIGLYRRKITKTVHGNSPITTSSCFNGALVDGVLVKDNNISCQSNLAFVCQLETDNVLDNDCVVFPSKETPWTTTELPELSSSDIQTTTSVETTDKASITTKKSAVVSKETDNGLKFVVLLGMGLLFIGGGLSSDYLRGHRYIAEIPSGQTTGPREQEVVGAIYDGSVSGRYEKLSISHNSDDMADISPRYSLFENHIYDVPEEVDDQIVSYGQHIDGRVSTFVHIPEQTVQLYISCIIGCIFLNGGIPLFYELSCEASYPIAEGITSTFLTLLNNIFEVVFLLALQIPNIGTSWMNWTLLGSIGVGLLFMLAFPESYDRTDLDITIYVPEPADSDTKNQEYDTPSAQYETQCAVIEDVLICSIFNVVTTCEYILFDIKIIP